MLASLVAVVHGTVVVCVVAGAMAAIAGVLRKRLWLSITYVALLVSLIASDRLLGECALTGFEKHLRNLDQPDSAYGGSFIGQYIPFLPRWIHEQVGPAIVVAGLLAVILWYILDRTLRGTLRRAPSFEESEHREGGT